MGRQIYFVQSEKDANSFLDYVYQIESCLLFKKQLLSIETAKEILSMLTWQRQASIVTSAYQGSLDDYECRVLGYSVELMLSLPSCKIDNSYEVGRIYIRRDPEGNFRADTLKRYNSLYRYIKKNYIYDKEYRQYYGPDLWKRLSDHSAVIVQNDRILPVKA